MNYEFIRIYTNYELNESRIVNSRDEFREFLHSKVLLMNEFDEFRCADRLTLEFAAHGRFELQLRVVVAPLFVDRRYPGWRDSEFC